MFLVAHSQLDCVSSCSQYPVETGGGSSAMTDPHNAKTAPIKLKRQMFLSRNRNIFIDLSPTILQKNYRMFFEYCFLSSINYLSLETSSQLRRPSQRPRKKVPQRPLVSRNIFLYHRTTSHDSPH